jgi:hypothetical protein
MAAETRPRRGSSATALLLPLCQLHLACCQQCGRNGLGSPHILRCLVAWSRTSVAGVASTQSFLLTRSGCDLPAKHYTQDALSRVVLIPQVANCLPQLLTEAIGPNTLPSLEETLFHANKQHSSMADAKDLSCLETVSATHLASWPGTAIIAPLPYPPST